MECMTSEQVDKLLSTFRSSEGGERTSVTETHISWVILAGGDVYKIKKPLHLHFLDFSTLEQRKFYCEKELALNRRLTEGIYLDVLPVVDGPEKISIGYGPGEVMDYGSQEGGGCDIQEVIDYAVHMRRMEDGRRMDKLLKAGEVTHADMEMLAGRIAAFHKTADIIRHKDPRDIPGKFADLRSEEEFLGAGSSIREAIGISDTFSEAHCKRVKERIAQGYTRDCHGDLHARNIFLLETPQPFDCIEFSDDLRQIDVLNENAFLCMDLDAFGREDLARTFVKAYQAHFPALETVEDERLFVYYKSYRANVRAKVNSLRARSAGTEGEKRAALAEAGKYLRLMNGYLRQLR